MITFKVQFKIHLFAILFWFASGCTPKMEFIPLPPKNIENSNKELRNTQANNRELNKQGLSQENIETQTKFPQENPWHTYVSEYSQEKIRSLQYTDVVISGPLEYSGRHRVQNRGVLHAISKAGRIVRDGCLKQARMSISGSQFKLNTYEILDGSAPEMWLPEGAEVWIPFGTFCDYEKDSYRVQQYVQSKKYLDSLKFRFMKNDK